MDATIKKKWVKALRSGRYKQTDSQLYDARIDAHCCLGVLCRVVRAERDGEAFIWDGEIDALELPLPLLAHVGMDGAQMGEVAKMNDDGKTFKEIANYIERQL
jgi:hypothetical protein